MQYIFVSFIYLRSVERCGFDGGDVVRFFGLLSNAADERPNWLVEFGLFDSKDGIVLL